MPTEWDDSRTDFCFFGEHGNCPGESKETGDYGATFGAPVPCNCDCHKAKAQSSGRG